MSNKDKIVPRPKEFVWAFERSANLKEPFEEMKKLGWRYGDVPTASHFNYLFHELGKWHEYLEHRIDGAQDDVASNYEAVLDVKRDLKIVISVLKVVVDQLSKLAPGIYLPKLPEVNS